MNTPFDPNMDIRAMATSLGLTGKARKKFMKKEKKKKKVKTNVAFDAQKVWMWENSRLPMFMGDANLYPDLFTIVLVADMTQSMQTAADAILKSFPWVYSLVSLLNVPVRVAVYHDYDGGE